MYLQWKQGTCTCTWMQSTWYISADRKPISPVFTNVYTYTEALLLVGSCILKQFALALHTAQWVYLILDVLNKWIMAKLSRTKTLLTLICFRYVIWQISANQHCIGSLIFIVTASILMGICITLPFRCKLFVEIRETHYRYRPRNFKVLMFAHILSRLVMDHAYTQTYHRCNIRRETNAIHALSSSSNNVL